MQTQFKAKQAVDITVHEQPVPIQHYLRQPHRVIKALVDTKRTEQVEKNVFRLKMRPLKFMVLSVQPTVDMKIGAQSDGEIHLESVGCKIEGIDFIDRRFNLRLKGILSPKAVGNQTHLVGQADLWVGVDVPPPLAFTPRSILEATGNSLLASVLATIKQRLMNQLLADYRTWAIAQRKQVETLANTSLLSPQRSSI